MFDVTERVREAREYFDKLLDERIRQISEISDVPLECFVKINPADFLERNKNQTIDGYEYIKIGQWIRENKKRRPHLPYIANGCDRGNGGTSFL